MNKQYIKIISELSEEDQRILRDYSEKLFDFKKTEDSYDEVKSEIKNAIEKVSQLEKKALQNIQKRKENPVCSSCGKKSTEVEKMFELSILNYLCNECVILFHDKLND